MKNNLKQGVLLVAAACSFLATGHALAEELSTRERCELALKMMGVSQDRTSRGWASLCDGVVKGDTITRYGKWYGPGYWGGSEDAGKAGLDAPVDSLDAVAQRHDYGYLVAEKYGKIYGRQYEYKLKAMADRVAVRDALALAEDPKTWPLVPKDPQAAARYRDRIITGFIIESDLYKNLADATKVGDVVTSPFINLFDQIDYSHVPDLEKFEREVKSYLNGWMKDVARQLEKDRQTDKDKQDKDTKDKKTGDKAVADAEKSPEPTAKVNAKEDREAQEARERLAAKIRESKREKPANDADLQTGKPEPSEPVAKPKKSYAEMTPEERHEALKSNDDEAWQALAEALGGSPSAVKEDDTQADDTETNAEPDPKQASDITPVELSASGSIDSDYSSGGFKNIVTTTVTITFWNVGSQVPGYGKAVMKTRSVASLNGATEENSCGGTFSGGPNGVFRFKGDCGGSMKLRGGSSIQADGMTLTVSNPAAFSAWQ